MFDIDVAPTFTADVKFHQAGKEEPAVIKFEFRHRTKAELGVYITGMKGKPDLDLVMDLAVGWEGVSKPFDRASVTQLLENFGGVAQAVWDTYYRELLPARLGN